MAVFRLELCERYRRSRRRTFLLIVEPHRWPNALRKNADSSSSSPPKGGSGRLGMTNFENLLARLKPSLFKARLHTATTVRVYSAISKFSANGHSLSIHCAS